MEQNTYQDKLILELRRKYRQKQPDTLAEEQKEWKRISLPGGLCSIMLPAYMQDMGQRERWNRCKDWKTCGRICRRYGNRLSFMTGERLWQGRSRYRGWTAKHFV